MQEYLETCNRGQHRPIITHPRTYRSFHSTNVAARSLRTIMTRSTRSSRRSADAPALAASIVEYRAHAGARSDAVPRLTVAISLNMIFKGCGSACTYLLRSFVTPPASRSPLFYLLHLQHSDKPQPGCLCCSEQEAPGKGRIVISCVVRSHWQRRHLD
jgi:hypothetical protein